MTGNIRPTKSRRVALLVVATGRYAEYIPTLAASMQRHFLAGWQRQILVFTDRPQASWPNCVQSFPWRKLGWPHDTLLRYHAYCTQLTAYTPFQYLYCCDADMRFVDTVGEEILDQLVATQHPGYYGRRGTPEDQQVKSLAYIPRVQAMQYFAGGFWGGLRDPVLNMIRRLRDNIQSDLSRGVIAKWHDESHLNKQFLIVPPTKILSPDYCFAENFDIPFHPRLLAISKDHASMRA